MSYTPHTLDPNREIPEDAAPSAGVSDEQAEKIREDNDAHREAVEAEPDVEVGPQEPGSQDDDESGEDSDEEEGGPPEGTIDEVLAWVGDDPDRAAQALQAEREGKQRATLISELEARQ